VQILPAEVVDMNPDPTPEELDVADLLSNPKRRKELHAMWQAWNESEDGKRERQRYLQSKERKL
jgi:hypothetical protein